MIGKGKRHYVLIPDFNTFMHDHTLHCGRKHFCCYSLQAFSTEEILKRHIKDCFKIDGKQGIKMPKNGEYLKLKNFERKIKAPFMTYADFENILVPEKMESKIQMSLIQTNIKNILLAVMAIN